MSGGLLARFRAGLARTRAAIGEQLRGLVSPGRPLDEAAFERLEEILITADVGVDTALRLVETVREQSRRQPVQDLDGLKALLRREIAGLLQVDGGEWSFQPGRLNVIMFVGVNGTGKTSTVGKLACRLTREGRRVLLAAADTFRAAAAEQLEIWARRAGADIVRQQPGADPAAVAFDAIQAGLARGADAVLIDTAGRLHTRVNLMAELQKVHRVCGRALAGAPHEVLLVIDATTGQNGLVQAQQFAQAVPLTGIVLTKLDGTARGGIVVAIAQHLRLPVKWVGLGEGPDDLAPFDAAAFVDALLGDDAAAAP
ncbi:MAG: signal recognition particle-docking protein FtsY [Thermaerobacter sp.]|nr:signal recognition particle-docking protein FtsY [Bacillota bacterium]REJ38100.1 MAG: signal recognition particle-docking protein FtsY [Bacillota bacterium]